MSDHNDSGDDAQNEVGPANETVSPVVWNQQPSQGQGANVNVYLGLTASYQSQLPPASEVRDLEALLPGTLDRLLGLQEKALDMGSIEQSHRHSMETEDSDRKTRGQLIAAGVFLMGLASTVLLAFNHEQSVAKVTGGGTLLGAVAIFVTGKWIQRGESVGD